MMIGQPTTILACPACGRTCRSGRETRPGARMRCPGCNGMFYFFVHGNGAVELRPSEEKPVIGSRLPPRIGGQGETQAIRTTRPNRRRNRPIGGYAPFEKSRSYIGMLAFVALLGLGALGASWYGFQIDAIASVTGNRGTNSSQLDLEGKRKDFRARQKRAMEMLKKQQVSVSKSSTR